MCLVYLGLGVAVKAFVFGLRRYFLDGWNLLDTAVFVCAACGLVWPALNFPIWFRCFHYLRLYFNRTTLYLMLFGSGRVYGTLVTALALTLVVALTYALIGVRIFAGRFNECLRCPPNEDGLYFKIDCVSVSYTGLYCTQALCEAAPWNVTGGTLQVLVPLPDAPPPALPSTDHARLTK